MAVYEITFSPTGGTDKVTELLTEAMDGEKRRISLLPERKITADMYLKAGISVLLQFLLLGEEFLRRLQKGLE